MPKETRRKRRRKQMLGSVEHNEWCQKEQFEKKLSKKNDAKGDTLLTHLVEEGKRYAKTENLLLTAGK